VARPIVDDIYPLSPLQEGILYHCLLAPGSGVYVTHAHWTLRGRLDGEALRAAWRHVLDRHAALRTAFVWRDRDRPLQVVRGDLPLPWTVHDWRERGPDEVEPAFDALLAADRAAGFRPEAAPLCRMVLVRTGDDAWRLLWSYHHLLLDGWSAGVVLDDLLAAYGAFASGAEPALPPTRPYRDYIAWAWEREGEAARRFWRRYFEGFEEPTPLPADREGGKPSGVEEHRKREARLDAETGRRLADLVRRRRSTLGVLAQGLWALVLAHWSGRRDVVFGLVVAGRPPELEGYERMVGLFINTVPLRVAVDPEAGLGDWLARLERRRHELHQYELSSLIEIQSVTGVPRGTPLFDTLLVFDNYPVSHALDDVRSGFPLDVEAGGGRDQNSAALTMTFQPTPEIGLELDGMTRHFSPARLDRLLGDVRALLEGAAERPEPTVGALLERLAERDRRHRRQARERHERRSRDRLRRLRPNPEERAVREESTGEVHVD
jgi:hypothetical protein